MKTVKKQQLPSKICLTCGRPFTWRKKWEKVWAEVKYCSQKCRMNKVVANTVIGNSSMGGLISLYAICEYPGIFGGAIDMSFHWPL